MSLPTFEFADGSRFIAQQRVAAAHDDPNHLGPFEGMEERDICEMCAVLWRDACDEKRPEIARLRRNSDYYDGRHYHDAWHNKMLPIENQCFRVVETQVANTVSVRPRPEIMPFREMGDDLADRLQDFATYLMELDLFDEAIYLGARDKFIYGWNVWVISFDYATGMPYPKCLSPFDFYKDPAARNENEMGYWHIGTPVSTAILRSIYPEAAAAGKIKPDNLASPSYEAAVRPWFEHLEQSVDFPGASIVGSALVVHNEGDTPTESTSLVMSPAEKQDHGVTTFLLQTGVRDDVMCDVTYYGEHTSANGDVQQGAKYVSSEPRTPTGWWLTSMTAGRQLLCRPKMIGPEFMGLPVVIDRLYQRNDRFWSQSSIDQIISPQRGINGDNEAIDRALALASNPALLADRGSGLHAQLQSGTVMGGELLQITRGSDVRYLEYRGPEPKHFERLQERRQIIQAIAGNHDAMEGARPVGVEAAAAIRRLDDNAMRRLRGGENPAHRARSLLLRKIMYAAGHKLQPEILFKGTAGDMRSVSGDELKQSFMVRFVPGSGLVEGRREMQDQALALYDRQAIDEESLLDTMQWPGRTKIVQRMVQRKLQEQVAIASAKASAPSSNGGSSSKSGSRVPARG